MEPTYMYVFDWIKAARIIKSKSERYNIHFAQVLLSNNPNKYTIDDVITIFINNKFNILSCWASARPPKLKIITNSTEMVIDCYIAVKSSDKFDFKEHINKAKNILYGVDNKEDIIKKKEHEILKNMKKLNKIKMYSEEMEDGNIKLFSFKNIYSIQDIVDLDFGLEIWDEYKKGAHMVFMPEFKKFVIFDCPKYTDINLIGEGRVFKPEEYAVLINAMKEIGDRFSTIRKNVYIKGIKRKIKVIEI